MHVERLASASLTSILDVADARDDQDVESSVPDARSARLSRLSEARGWSFPSPIGAFAATRVAGFEPVGQVFGTTVAFLGSGGLPYPGPPGFGRCFVREVREVGEVRESSATPAQLTTADPHNPLLAALNTARGQAVDRALAECEALGGDGIIGMRLTRAEFFTHTVELTVEGTAVRAHASTRPAAPFTTHVSGQDLARLLDAGWLPFALVFGAALAACHFDDTMFQQTRRGVGSAGNREVTGYTRIVNDARREARRTLEHAVREHGGAGAVIQDATLQFSERECPRQFEQRADYLAEATIVGSVIGSWPAPTRQGVGASRARSSPRRCCSTTSR